MNRLKGKRLVVVSNVHRIDDARTYHRQARLAAREGMDVSVIAIGDGVSMDDVSVEPYERPRSRWARFWLGMLLTYRAWRRRADLVHFHDPEMLVPMALMRVLSRKPVIYDCHENVVDSIHYKPYLSASIRGPLARAVYAAQWCCSKMIGRVVLATPEQASMFPASTRQAVVRNFPPYTPPPDSATERPYDLVHCGTLSPERGSRVLLEALRMVVHDHGRTDCRLLLVGVGRDDLDAELADFIATHRLESNLECRGYVPLRDVPAALRQAKIGIMCHQHTKQYRYGVASKLFDYMASGLAIVGGSADFDRDYAPEGLVKVYVDETQPRQYARAIVDLLDDECRREQLGSNARRLFEDNYTAEVESKQLLRLYEESLGLLEAA